jgi:hypothetical protein
MVSTSTLGCQCYDGEVIFNRKSIALAKPVAPKKSTWKVNSGGSSVTDSDFFAGKIAAHAQCHY